MEGKYTNQLLQINLLPLNYFLTLSKALQIKYRR